MNQMEEMPTKYDPKEIESRWYKYWLEGKYFEAKGGDKPPYTIVIPPPNVTGRLHMGHAMNTTLQDILTRAHRMQGFDALYLPGMDHAGIATQAKVEEKLREQGVSRYDLGREKFVEKVWEWKESYAEQIRQQWEKLGLGLDYSRERFTLDEGLSQAVREVFVRLYEAGLIYRGKYIINWDPAARTALSDIEVIYKEVQGALYHIKYPLEDGSGYIQIATTRPETMLGDIAIAVHPDDERYQALIGKKAILPLVGRAIPIIADDYVDREFGSGAVKITPAHDPNDFEIGLRHHLEPITVMDETGTMNEHALNYQGLDRFECRKRVVEDLQTLGLLVKIEEHLHSVGHSERSGAVVEPYLSTQWFVKMQPLAERAIERQRTEGKVQFVPERFEKIYLHWIENVRDWCISRQLWWGHRIPAWHCADCGEITVSREDATHCAHCGSTNIEQDTDVLDTWFSSALWPFSTLGWPNKTADLERYFPTNVLVTGHDIIFFWVARMLFTSLEFMEEIPFKETIITGLIRDAQGRKMSKSLGNGIDPMDVIDQYGADALRYMLATGSTPGNDQRFYWERVEAARNFANKIWNASRFVLMNLDGFTLKDLDLSGSLRTADRWILHRLNETIADVDRLMKMYEFGEVGRVLHNFIWDDFCDWYIELAKLYLYGDQEDAKQQTKSVLVYVLDKLLKLLHPMMPFITEEIWQHLPHEGESITVASWPEQRPEFNDPQAKEEMEVIMSIIRAVRNIRAEVNVPMSKEIQLWIQPQDEHFAKDIELNHDYLVRFCNPEELKIDIALQRPDKAMSAVVTGADIYLPLAGLIDIEQEITRLEKELADLNQEVARAEKKLSNPQFVERAPEQVVAQEREKANDYRIKREKVKGRIKELQM
ncbi:valine--tRNA ligase [Rubeoparvulum massiliense]|uniref:valine--tRNA ligase n=1 Tax=Rubeoparvulum massiliense TaxID=1631346 RepID=UPI00065E346C|nr:valine--tRNA ligase [Rubeoparvulum massiliense]